MLDKPDLNLFVDGSRYADNQGRYHTGYAVTSSRDVLQAHPLSPDKSAQEAELIALTEACRMAEKKTANIYTDSRYAFGVALDFGPIWKSRNFITANGTPVKNAGAVQALMEALTLPKQVAILKVKAHLKADTPETQGNARADRAAKEAAMRKREEVKMMIAQTRSKVARNEAGKPHGLLLTKETLEDIQEAA
ncbi:ribonuclease H-like [Bufo bufo]|uniref:ribonuclease H-like n=1 Tax=Bufo bufo TaxID=8384 RepID=UPI001ABE9798|nr:ribonuclease H-like [Bufo bufo]